MLPRTLRLLSALLCATTLTSLAGAQNLTDDEINLVSTRLAESAKTSWELGTRSQAILELSAPQFSVLTVNATQPPSTSVPVILQGSLSQVFQIAKSIVQNRTISNGNITGAQPLVNDTSAGDSASLGMAVLLASWTGQYKTDGIDYSGAAQDQLDFLFEKVPHTSDGAISHMTNQVQLWSDSVYMTPPFLAYYGVIFANQSVLYEAYNQIALYRSYLRDNSSDNLWRHVLLGTNDDTNHWSTGNAWAAAGMLRVLGTIRNSQYSSSMTSEQTDLITWIQEIHDGMYKNMDSNYVFRNYADQPVSATNFYDAASTALMAATVYRLQLITGIDTYIGLAESSRMVLSTPTPSNTSANAEAAANGVATVTLLTTTISGTKTVMTITPTLASNPSALPFCPIAIAPVVATTTVASGSLSTASSAGSIKAKRATTESTETISAKSSSKSSAELQDATSSTHTTTPSSTPTPATSSAKAPSSAASKSSVKGTVTSNGALTAASSVETVTATVSATGGLPAGCIELPLFTTTVTATASMTSATAPAAYPTSDGAGPLAHFTENGWLTPVVNPYNAAQQGEDSPEAEAFVIMMQAAYQDWAAANATTIDTAHKSASIRSSSVHVPLVSAFLGVGALLHFLL